MPGESLSKSLGYKKKQRFYTVDDVIELVTQNTMHR